MRRRLGWLKFVGAAALLALILLRPEAAVSGGQRAMRQWYSSVAPSLFPFLALLPALTGAEACRFYDRMLSPVMRRAFDLPGSAASAMVVAMLAGSPGGAIAVSRVAGSGGLTRNEAQRLALAMCGLSPAYLVLGVGQGLLGSAGMGWRLAGMQLAVQLTLLVCLRAFRFAGDEPCKQTEEAAAGGMRSAVESILVVCGYMVLFGAISSVMASFAGERVGGTLLLLCDLPGGLAQLRPGTLGMCAAIGFTGLCISLQNLDRLRSIGVRMGDHLCVRGISAALFAGLGSFLLETEGWRAQITMDPTKIYSISLLLAGIFAVPGMILLTKNLFLNKGEKG